MRKNKDKSDGYISIDDQTTKKIKRRKSETKVYGEYINIARRFARSLNKEGAGTEFIEGVLEHGLRNYGKVVLDFEELKEIPDQFLSEMICGLAQIYREGIRERVEVLENVRGLKKKVEGILSAELARLEGGGK